jgi:hypothetical protein
MKGAGQKPRRDHDNPGLIAGAAALNGSTSSKMATEICNAVNKLKFPNKFEAEYNVCRNTFMSTLKAHTDFLETRAVLRQKTGKKDPGSNWAVAPLTIAEQMLEQIKIGKQLDLNEITYHDVYTNPDPPPPIFPDAVLHVDENHTVASLGGAGHYGSFAHKQYFVSINKRTGALKKVQGQSCPATKVSCCCKVHHRST